MVPDELNDPPAAQRGAKKAFNTKKDGLQELATCPRIYDPFLAWISRARATRRSTCGRSDWMCFLIWEPSVNATTIKSEVLLDTIRRYLSGAELPGTGISAHGLVFTGRILMLKIPKLRFMVYRSSRRIASKIHGVLASATPLVDVAHKGYELADLTLEHGVGMLAPATTGCGSDPSAMCHQACAVGHGVTKLLGFGVWLAG